MIDAVAHRSRLLILIAFAVCLSGCQTMRGMLKPHVCDCTPDAVAQDCPAQPDEADDEDGALLASQQATSTAVERATAETEPEHARPDQDAESPSLRTLERDAVAEEPAKDPLELVDPLLEDAIVDVSDDAQIERVREMYGVAPDEERDAVVLSGNFSQQSGSELLVFRPDEGLLVHGADGRLAQLEFDGQPAADVFAELGVCEEECAVAKPVRLVKDDTVQVLVHWREETDEGAYAYKAGAFKVIGKFVGRIFERTLAVSEAEDDELVRRGTYEVLRGDSHRFIRWIPADESGQLLTDQAEVLEWNRWEGVFRVPKPPPTAPDRDEMRSQRGLVPAGSLLVWR